MTINESPPDYKKGLEGVIVAHTRICLIDGHTGKLYYRGYELKDLVTHCTYEQVCYLLLFGELPTIEELQSFTTTLRDVRSLPAFIFDILKTIPKEKHPMEILQSGIALLCHQDSEDPRAYEKAIRIIAQLPTLIAAIYRIQSGQKPISPLSELSHGSNFLYMLRGKKALQQEGEILDKCFIIHAEHGLNASTFTARVAASTFSNYYSAISAAIGTLFGPLHGGANEKVMSMLDAISVVENAQSWVENQLKQKKKIMGMGHRIYKVRDPRALLLEKYLVKLSRMHNTEYFLSILKSVEETFYAQMHGKSVHPNMDFFSGSVYRLLDIDTSLFTPLFALSRSVGWLAHIKEQYDDNRIFRPNTTYIGSDIRSISEQNNHLKGS